jgi:hypothetical protein
MLEASSQLTSSTSHAGATRKRNVNGLGNGGKVRRHNDFMDLFEDETTIITPVSHSLEVGRWLATIA